MKKNLLISTLAIILFALQCPQSINAQLVLSSSPYTQDFNSIESGLPTGWEIRTSASATALGTLASWSLINSSPLSNSWAATSGRFANHAAAVSDFVTNYTGSEIIAIQQAATNRALAIRQTGSVGDPGGAFVLRVQDTIGQANFGLQVDFQMLNVQTRSTTWTVDYAVGNSPSSFIPLATYTDPGAFGTRTTNISFGNALDNQTENVWIRVVALSASTGSGSRDTFGIDNVVLTYSASNVTNPVAITSQPQSRTNLSGSLATFTVAVSGTGPITYQWYKDNVSNPVGANSPLLSLPSVSSADAGGYFVVATNILNSVTSQVATLTVLDPAITTQPAARTNVPGANVSLFAVATGSEPITYQWRFNGAPISSATSSNLILTNVVVGDSGNYSVVVSNALGASITSSVAPVSIIAVPSSLLVRWDFNDTNAVPTNPPPSSGSGTIEIAGYGIGGTNVTFAGGTLGDPAFAAGTTNFGMNTQFYPTNITANNKEVGTRFNVSTVGKKDVLVSWEERHSNTATKYQRFQYSTDGVNFVDGPVVNYGVTDNSFVFYSVDLSGVTAVNNNANFAYRLVAEFESTAVGGAANYVGTTTYGGGNSGGTIRYDMMSVYGNILALSANADLSALTLSTGTLSPAFAAATTSYTASVPNATASITATPTAADAGATIQARVNGGGFSAVTSGSPSGALALNVGTNSVEVKVTAADTVTTKTYNVLVTRTAPTAESITLIPSGGNVVLNWTQAGWKLYTGTNVTAVTNLVPGATSPYTNSLLDPQRYFRLVYP